MRVFLACRGSTVIAIHATAGGVDGTFSRSFFCHHLRGTSQKIDRSTGGRNSRGTNGEFKDSISPQSQDLQRSLDKKIILVYLKMTVNIIAVECTYFFISYKYTCEDKTLKRITRFWDIRNDTSAITAFWKDRLEIYEPTTNFLR